MLDGWLRRQIVMLCLCGIAHAEPAAEQRVFRIATLMPEGTAPANAIRKFTNRLEEKWDNKVKIKVFFSGVQGDELDVVRKMQNGQLSGAALTAMGLSLIHSDVRVFEIPLLIRSYAELDYSLEKLDIDLRNRLEKRGYMVLSWADVGPIYILSKKQLKTKADFAGLTAWVFDRDPLVRAYLTHLGAKVVPLDLPEVLPALASGRIDACYGPPLITLGLQWHQQAKYMTAAPFGFAVAAAVLTKRDFDSLTPDEQMSLLVEAKAYERVAKKAVRDANNKALEELRRLEVNVVELPRETRAQLEAESIALLPSFEKNVFSHQIRLKLDEALAAFRARTH